MFPQSPKLIWLLQNVTTSTLKERVQGKNLTVQEAEFAYLRSFMSSQQQAAANPTNALLCEQLQAAFSDQSCFPVPNEGSDAFPKRMEKLARTCLESERNHYVKGAVLNGPLFESILVSMLAHRANVFQVSAFIARLGRASLTLMGIIRVDRLFEDGSGKTQSTTAV